jgi:hypothetical protein
VAKSVKSDRQICIKQKIQRKTGGVKRTPFCSHNKKAKMNVSISVALSLTIHLIFSWLSSKYFFIFCLQNVFYVKKCTNRIFA